MRPPQRCWIRPRRPDAMVRARLPQTLDAEASAIAGRLPELLLRAERLARTVTSGAHGRRLAGAGPDFWQYRAAIPGDPLSSIDWRRSARSDHAFVAEREWALAQSLQLWRDPGLSLHYRSDKALPTKAERAALIGLALGILALRGGERVGLADGRLAPAPGERQVARILQLWEADHTDTDFVAPPRPEARASMAVYLSDGLSPEAGWVRLFEAARAARVTGTLVLIHDPAEREFPFTARTRFTSVSGAQRHETDRAEGLRARYLARRADHRAALGELARRAGWRVLEHGTDMPPSTALLALSQMLSMGAGA